MTKKTQHWYTSWFDTPFYHILYKDRDHTEAQIFMDNLTEYLNIPEGGSILDLACGKGRHSIYLNSLGYQVTGVDLSENSIAYAKQFENETLHFEVHDMCKPYKKQFDAVFNLFTSFGYFDNEDDNLNTIKAIKANLNEFGFGVIDFMNSNYVIDQLVAENTKTVEGIDFKQQRYVEDGYIIKDISFAAEGQDFKFQERVKAFTLKDFETLFEKAGVHLLDVFGDYRLRKFDTKTSERLIMIFK
ncbi:bifunctional 2-polyprenyl-6-hydroxyphenol methylase/3-demethylubiquinol 3-O-methyltransferase UbiG [Psychroserpens sp. SPM9]|uniref:class I SAM-dependent methyltransferase n=1 Tax=Psychroserpens sp. SPM9 TaxID=2975598 RepID=UPI0021A80D2D|nr:class I SAM-dependent methyltransferase [Psychroserpens sp. SPM9]MDG5491393.1 class I SAM-dependent methyltransferase [Psychroserpens sp. SPM9]